MQIDFPASLPLAAKPLHEGQIRDSAQSFEALLISQMLRGARAAGGEGWFGCGDDQAGETMVALAEEHLAQVLAASGGLGLARMVKESLRQPGST
jgi:Rod binding domain-containing protein